MKSEMLKIAGVKSEKEFYKKYPTEAAFKKAHPKAFKKAEMGASMVKKQLKQLTDFGNPYQAQDGFNFADTLSGVQQNLAKSQQETPDKPTALDSIMAATNSVKEVVGKNGRKLQKAQGGWSNIANAIGGAFTTPGKAATATSAATPASGGLGDTLGDIFGGAGGGAKGIKQAGQDVFKGGFKSGMKNLGTKAGLGAAGKAVGMEVLNAAPQILQGVSQIKQQKKAIKKADQMSQISGLTAQAAESRPEQIKNQYTRPEDQLVQPGQMGSPQGTGTNFLAQYGASIGGNPTEIQNTYNPGDLYSDLGYEPLNDSNVKQFQKGGKLISRDIIDVDSYGNQGTAFRDIFQNPNMTQDTTYAYDSPSAMLRYNTNSGKPYAYVGGRGGFNSSQPDSLSKYKELLNAPFRKATDMSSAMRQADATERLARGKYEYGGDLPTAEFGDYFQDSGQASIGKGVGSAVGSIFGPLGSKVGGFVGGVAGNLLGGAQDANRLARYQTQTKENTERAAWQKGGQDIQSANASFMKDGGWMNPEYNPQVIAKFGDYSMNQLLQPPHDADMLRAGGHLKEYTPPSAEAMFTGRSDVPKAQTGLLMGPLLGLGMSLNKGMVDTLQNSDEANMIKSAVTSGMMQDGGYMAMGGDLQTHWGGYMEPISNNPYLPDGGMTYMPRGQSHDETNGKGQSGIGITYGDNPVEVERGEPIVKLEDGGTGDNSLTVFGNMVMPKYALEQLQDPKAKGMKFKNYANDLSKSEAKQNRVIDKATKLINISDTNDPFEQLTLNAGRANLMGANTRLQNIAAKKTMAAGIQNAILDTAKEQGLVSDELAKGRIVKDKEAAKQARFGAKMETAQDGYYFDKDTRQMELDSEYLPTETSSSINQAYTSPVTSSYITGIDPLGRYAGPEEVFTDVTKDKSKSKFDWKGLAESAMSNLAPLFRPSNQEQLDPSQLMGEQYALASNQLEPVRAQQFQPMLESPYDISLQDQLNEVDAQARAATRQLGSNPAAAAQIFAQAADAKNKIRGEKMRIDQAQKAQVYGKNRDLLNQAQIQNLGILDQQYVRQAQAKSKTKEQALEALSSISSKIAQNKLENRKLGVMENMYNYRFGPQGQAYNVNAPAQFNIPEGVGKTPEEIRAYADLVDAQNKAKAKKDTAQKRNGAIVQGLKNLKPL